MSQETKILSIIGVVTLIIVVGAVFFLGKSSTPGTNLPTVGTETLKILAKDTPNKIATDSAKVNIVEFSDFQCPACAAAEPVVKQVLQDYNGRVNFFYRHFPLSQHKNATPAALAAEAAGEQGRFWEMHDKLFAKQEEWSESDDPMSNFLGYAAELSLDIARFKADMEGQKNLGRVKDDQADGLSIGVNSTPTFFVDGQKLSDFSYNTFKMRIDAQLSK